MNKFNYKRILSTSVATIATVVLYSNTVFGAVGTVVIDSGNLNVRKAATVDSEIVTTLENNSSVQVVSLENSFYKVNVNGVDSYVSKDFIVVSETVGTILGDSVRIRSVANTSGDILGNVNTGETLTVVAKADDWYKVKYNDKYGYIRNDFITVELSDGLVRENVTATQPIVIATSQSETEVTYGLIIGDGVNLRQNPSTDANILVVLPNGYAVDYVESSGENGWVKVQAGNEVGFVSEEFVELKYGIKPENVAVQSSIGSEIAAFGQKYIGTPYSWGGTSLSSGVDCSGFVYAVYQNFGYTLNRVASDQYNNGTKVNRSELSAGDIIVFDTSGGNNGVITHSGIYIGDGNFVHSSSSKGGVGVIVSSLSSGYYDEAYVGATRVAN
ncbi:MAG: SH3 domain-containing protein [Lachnospirales bacterium]